nr:uncharacterized protein CTRU02_14056 [Colletotrichum truncatum]KAF6782575.1 hypothetical protein CTRU02_14056 [Colletotrichum truncatum]
MHLSSLLVTALIYVSGGLADCYTTGRKSSFQSVANHASALCRDFFSGGYAPRESRRRCILDDEGKRWDFEVRVSATIFPALRLFFPVWK